MISEGALSIVLSIMQSEVEIQLISNRPLSSKEENTIEKWIIALKKN